MDRYPLLHTIHEPQDLRNLSLGQLSVLADELRDFMIKHVAETGGHLASSLGTVELIIALHRVFNSPQDKLIFDVGHQAYAHKLLTGRWSEFASLRQQNGISGFPKRRESIHDAFDTGHASTSISAALGMIHARELRGTHESVIAVIGDGALTGGMAFEALNDAGQSKLPMIIVLNDNNMSISKNVGAINRYLSDMRTSNHYQKLKRSTVRMLDGSAAGKRLSKRMERFKRRIKYFLLPNVLFEAFGFTYLGPIDGHDTEALIQVLKQAKRLNCPVIVHAVTQKGKGYPLAENNPEQFHGVSPFIPETGQSKKKCSEQNATIFGNALVRLAEQDAKIVAITAAMPIGTGLLPLKERFPDRFFDVGIAEQHAVTMAAGMATAGLHPVVAIYSTFLQRAYDQILHDVCLQELPVVFAIDRAGLVGEDGETHQGVYDIAYLSALPNITIYSPATRQELEDMLKDAIQLQRPAAIRYNKACLMEGKSTSPITVGTWERLLPGDKVTLIATGCMVEPALQIAQKYQIGCINARFLKPMDTALLQELQKTCNCVITLEDGVTSCGLGSRIATAYSGTGIAVRCLGIPDQPVEQGTMEQQRVQCGLSLSQIEKTVLEMMQRYG